MKENFFESGVCSSRLHCGLCRQPAAGREWRTDLLHHFNGPTVIDFACPHGILWNQDPISIKKAVVGVVKAITGTGGASEELIQKRTAICTPCENAETLAGILERCKLCGCSTLAKIRNVDERCPIGKW